METPLVLPACDVCFEAWGPTVVPAFFPCGHDLCVPCLTEVVMQNGGRTLRCHLCRVPVTNWIVPHKIRTPEGGLEALEAAWNERKEGTQDFSEIWRDHLYSILCGEEEEVRAQLEEGGGDDAYIRILKTLGTLGQALLDHWRAGPKDLFLLRIYAFTEQADFELVGFSVNDAGQYILLPENELELVTALGMRIHQLADYLIREDLLSSEQLLTSLPDFRFTAPLLPWAAAVDTPDLAFVNDLIPTLPPSAGVSRETLIERLRSRTVAEVTNLFV